jgi:hypothetical protein
MQSRVVRKAIVNKLGCEESQGRKHIKYRFVVKGKCVATTHLPRQKEIGPGLLGDIARELYIASSQLQDIVDCVHEREGYIEMLKKSPLLIEQAPDNVKEFLLTL